MSTWVLVDRNGIIDGASVDDGTPEAKSFLGEPIPRGYRLDRVEGYVTIGAHVSAPMVYPPKVSTSPDLGGLITRLDDLATRMRANRYEIHADCCNDTDNAVPCTSSVCKIEYEAELLLREALAVLQGISAPEEKSKT